MPPCPGYAFAAIMSYTNASGRLDHLPTSIVDKFPKIVEFEGKMMALPAVAAHYAK